jgi:hypothetical protein
MADLRDARGGGGSGGSWGTVLLDGKDLKDTEEYYRALKARDLSRRHFTARDVRMAMVIVTFAYGASLTNAAAFERYVGAAPHVARTGPK